MGVKSLWELLEPCGRRVDVESLRGKRLAVDASVWLYQFLRAMRDANGEPLKDAHLLGFFRRLCKLLYLQVRPIFVFDGAAPALKRQTLQARAMQAEMDGSRLRRAAEKLLVNRLKQRALLEVAARKRERGDRTGRGTRGEGDAAGDVTAGTPGGAAQTPASPGATVGGSRDAASPASAAPGASAAAPGLDHAPGSDPLLGGGADEGESSAGSVSSSGDEEALLDLASDEELDPEALVQLPPSMQLEVLLRRREAEAARNRSAFARASEKPEDFSRVQIERYLRGTLLRAGVEKARQAAGIRAAEEAGARAVGRGALGQGSEAGTAAAQGWGRGEATLAAAGPAVGDLGPPNRGLGDMVHRRIASEAGREYLLVREGAGARAGAGGGGDGWRGGGAGAPGRGGGAAGPGGRGRARASFNDRAIRGELEGEAGAPAGPPPPPAPLPSGDLRGILGALSRGEDSLDGAGPASRGGEGGEGSPGGPGGEGGRAAQGSLRRPGEGGAPPGRDVRAPPPAPPISFGVLALLRRSGVTGAGGLPPAPRALTLEFGLDELKTEEGEGDRDSTGPAAAVSDEEWEDVEDAAPAGPGAPASGSGAALVPPVAGGDAGAAGSAPAAPAPGAGGGGPSPVDPYRAVVEASEQRLAPDGKVAPKDAALHVGMRAERNLHWRERANRRQKFWSASHGFQFGRKLGDWGRDEGGAGTGAGKEGAGSADGTEEAGPPSGSPGAERGGPSPAPGGRTRASAGPDGLGEEASVLEFSDSAARDARRPLCESSHTAASDEDVELDRAIWESLRETRGRPRRGGSVPLAGAPGGSDDPGPSCVPGRGDGPGPSSVPGRGDGPGPSSAPGRGDDPGPPSAPGRGGEPSRPEPSLTDGSEGPESSRSDVVGGPAPSLPNESPDLAQPRTTALEPRYSAALGAEGSRASREASGPHGGIAGGDDGTPARIPATAAAAVRLASESRADGARDQGPLAAADATDRAPEGASPARSRLPPQSIPQPATIPKPAPPSGPAAPADPVDVARAPAGTPSPRPSPGPPGAAGVLPYDEDSRQSLIEQELKDASEFLDGGGSGDDGWGDALGPPPLTRAPAAGGAGDAGPAAVTPFPTLDLLDALADEEALLSRDRRSAAAATEAPTAEMYAEVAELLALFGVPYVVAPAEAEAQCAALDRMGVVEGVVTDDNDAFLFGASRVYRRLFRDSHDVEEYVASDVLSELGLSRERLVDLALLLGSDYTPGVRGIGIVNAAEVVRCFRGSPGLEAFADWAKAPDEAVVELARGVVGGVRGPVASTGPAASPPAASEGAEALARGAASEDEATARAAFAAKHRGARGRWEFPNGFPSAEVIREYLSPRVDEATSTFRFAQPDPEALRAYATARLGWQAADVASILDPAVEAAGRRSVQRSLEPYLAFRQRFAKFSSKRLATAVAGMRGKGEGRWLGGEDGEGLEKVPSDEPGEGVARAGAEGAPSPRLGAASGSAAEASRESTAGAPERPLLGAGSEAPPRRRGAFALARKRPRRAGGAEEGGGTDALRAAEGGRGGASSTRASRG